MMTWQYIAGFFDGEGSIRCYEYESASGNPKRQFQLSIYQNTRQVLDLIAEFFAELGIESKVFTHTRPDRLARGHSGSYMLQIGSMRNVYLVLFNVLPFLIVKRDKALETLEWMLSLLDEMEAGNMSTAGSAKRGFAALKAVV